MRYSCFSPVTRLAIILIAISGCGVAKDQPELGKVTGVVTLDGKPLADAIVEFRPEQGRPSSGLTDDEGHYSLVYLGDTQGALIGTHSVRISTERYATQPDGSTMPVPEKVPAKYHRLSELKEAVKSGKNQFNFELTSK